jgi:hypothetical protein
MRKLNSFLVLSVALSLIVCLAGCSGNGYIPEPPQGNLTPGGMAYAWYVWPQISGQGFSNFDVLLTIDVDSSIQSSYYWAHQFAFKNGDGGYIGLQTNGYMQDAWVGKMAIFSIWDALEAEPGPGASCERFTGEGEGWSCRKKYNWVEGHTYCLRIEAYGIDEQENEWWGAWIIDTSTYEEIFLGRIKVPASWQRLDNYSAVWVEYYGKVINCNSIPYAEARFEQPTANDGIYSPKDLTTVIGTTCPNANITLLENKGVIFETGSLF